MTKQIETFAVSLFAVIRIPTLSLSLYMLLTRLFLFLVKLLSLLHTPTDVAWWDKGSRVHAESQKIENFHWEDICICKKSDFLNHRYIVI